MTTSLSGLSNQRVRLVHMIQGLNFGRIEGLRIEDGQPDLRPSPSVIRDHKFGGDNGPRPEMTIGDFLLKKEVVELFTEFDRIKHGTIDFLEVKHGLPFRMAVREVSA